MRLFSRERIISSPSWSAQGRSWRHNVLPPRLAADLLSAGYSKAKTTRKKKGKKVENAHMGRNGTSKKKKNLWQRYVEYLTHFTGRWCEKKGTEQTRKQLRSRTQHCGGIPIVWHRTSTGVLAAPLHAFAGAPGGGWNHCFPS